MRRTAIRAEAVGRSAETRAEVDVETFIACWTAREGGAERANYRGFHYDLCEVLGVAKPDVSGADVVLND